MKKKLITTGIIILAVAAMLFTGWSYIRNARKQEAPQTVTLAKSDLVDSVLVSGTVESSNSKNVISKLTGYQIKETRVKVGDKVKAGDLLALLDTSGLEKDIQQTQLNISNAETALQNEASANQSGIKNAQNSVKLAEIELSNAQTNYDRLKELSDTGANSANDLQQAETALEKARISYENAKLTLQNSQSKNTTTSSNNLKIQKLALEKQQKTLKDARITAPIDGTVTMVNAKAGEASTGLLFIVEDTENLIVNTSIGEYDIALIKLGQEVTIKSDSTGDQQFTGTVTQIAPTAKRDNSGNLTASSNVEFDTEVSMKSNNSSIRIGMNVRLTIKLGEKKGVYSVPYDAVLTETDGSEYVNVLETTEKNGRNTYTLKKLKVETGMETDMDVEIRGDGLRDGLQVLASAPENNGKALGAAK